jgi:hypothetical protein
MLSRKRQLVAKIESVEGTVETLAAADAKILAYNPKLNYNFSTFERNPARASMSQVGKIIGKRPGTLSCDVELRGSGTVGTSPEWAKLLQACGFEINVLKILTIGAITGGPFQHGETITATGSGATGRVIIKTVTGTATLYFVSTNAFIFTNGDVITGATSAATATVSGSAPINAGKEFKMITDAVPSLTLGSYEDGMRKLLKGARGKVKFAHKSGEPVMMNYEFQGVDGGVSDLALLSGVTYETTVPPAFLSAQFLIDAFAAKVGEIDIDVASELSERDDINAAVGILSYAYGGRKVSGSFNPEMMTVAAYDLFTKLIAGITAILDFTVGSVAGNKFRFYAPTIQYTKIDDQDRGGIAVASCQFDLNGSITPGNDELTILAL